VSRVAVIGGGAVGLCTARSLAIRGSDVVVLERGVCGAEASHGNAGWITPALSEPIAAPGAVAQALRWMMRVDSPFRLRPRLDSALASWLWRFWRSSGKKTFSSGLEALVRLNASTLVLFEELQQELGFEMHSDGLLFVARSRARIDAYARVLAEISRAGYQGSFELIEGEALREVEPALAGGLAGGVYVPDERHVRPEDFVATLAAGLRGRGVEIREQADVRLEADDGRVSCRLDDGEERPDAVVVAAGAWSATLLGGVGFRLPLQAAKGYSLTIEPGTVVPRRPLYLAEERLGVSPFRDHVRLAGMLELTGVDLRLDARRVDAVRAAATRYLRPDALSPGGEAWTGLRPLLPDTLPAIGVVPGYRNLYVATGHGTLGITLAPATAELLADMIGAGGAANGDGRIRPDRFAQRHRQPMKGEA
jgi:D-amino-acid dehydrogenase